MPENYITCQDEKGSINISEDVVAAMVRAAITEVDGVAGVATSTGTELAELLGIKSAAKGIKVQIVDGTMTVDTIITVRYGCSVVAVAKAVQTSNSTTSCPTRFAPTCSPSHPFLRNTSKESSSTSPTPCAPYVRPCRPPVSMPLNPKQIEGSRCREPMTH